MVLSHKNYALLFSSVDIDKFHLQIRSGDHCSGLLSKIYSYITEVGWYSLRNSKHPLMEWEIYPWDFQGWVLNLEDPFTIPVSAMADVGIAWRDKKSVLFFVSSAKVKVQVYLCSSTQFIYVLFTLGQPWTQSQCEIRSEVHRLTTEVICPVQVVVSITLTANKENRLKLTKKRRLAMTEFILNDQDWSVCESLLSSFMVLYWFKNYFPLDCVRF